MKRAFHILIAILVCVSYVSGQEKSTKERDGLKGPVHIVRIQSYLLSKESGNEQPRYGATIYSYDIEGFKTKEDYLMMDGTLSRQKLFTYDAKKRIAEEADYLSDGSLREKIIYKYEDETAEAAVYGPDGSLSYKVIFRFALAYDLGGLTGLQGVDRFYREGRWIEAAQYDSGGALIRRYTAVNNRGGRVITLRALNESSEGQRINTADLEYIYDTNGNLLDRHLILNNARIKLDADNNKAGVDRALEYRFDFRGNWTRRDFHSNGEIQVERRMITYY